MSTGMTRRKVVAFVASVLAATFAAAIAGVVFDAPSWGIYLTWQVCFIGYRIRDAQGGDA